MKLTVSMVTQLHTSNNGKMASTATEKDIKFVIEPTSSKSIEDAMKIIQDGTNLWKVKSINNLYSRKFFYNTETECITYEGSKKRIESPEIVELRDVHDVRKGWRTNTFNKIAQQMEKDRNKAKSSSEKEMELDQNLCFSIIYGSDHRSLDLLCPTEEICNQWVIGLNHLIAVNKSSQRNELYNKYPMFNLFVVAVFIAVFLTLIYKWLKDVFSNADATKSGDLSFDEVFSLLMNLHIDINKEQARDLFNVSYEYEKSATVQCPRRGVSVICEKEFAVFYALLKERRELNDLFYKYSNGEEMLNPSQLLAFIQTEQKVTNLDENKTAALIDRYEPTDARAASSMSLEGFQCFLLSEEMDVFDVRHRLVFQDMEHPLSFYYIASSHNTYLMADQLAGESSIEGYIRALKMGCRCVEIDLWDGDDNEPIIYHGYTLTSKILLKDVLSNAIKAYSFARTEYPVILSLENHLSVDQQKTLANHLTTILGDMLYTQPIDEMSNLPSPALLKNKIIIKNKKHSPKHKEDDTVSVDSEDDDECCPAEIDNKTSLVDSTSSDEKSSQKSWMPWKKSKRIPSSRLKLAQELSDLVNICTAVHFRNFEHSKKHGKWHEMSSLSETKAYTLAESEAENFVEYNRKQLIRIYPSGKRQDSSNYDPIPLWNVGSHMVALNYQTCGKYMTFNTALFLTNGQCGYVLKPPFLVKGIYDVGMISSGVMYRVMITIEIISGQHLPRADSEGKGEIINPYVIVKVRGHEVDNKTFKTKVVQNNGFNPAWNEVFTFYINVPQLAFLNFIVRDSKGIGRDDTLGEYCIHFENIQQGYRHVHLVDEYNRPIVPASIFVHVTIN